MESSNIAHKISSQKRTSDVLSSENVDFAGLLLSDPILKGLQASGFEKPSPIQLKAIPLGRCGLDLIVQAKSGTGKTCVFSVIALESLQLTSPALQVLVLAPTREIAVQIQDVIKNIGSCLSRMACHTFIGGLPVKEDINKLKRCHIAIGSPGRVKQLIESGLMKTESIRLFILDEADKLLEESFQEQINWIYSSLPNNKQILALSATYPEYLANHLRAYMRNPTFIRLNISDPALLGIKQYYTKVPHHPLPNKDLETKTKVVIEILSSVTFKQCLIFSNFQTRAQNLCNDLQVQGWPTSCIAGSLDQKERLAAMVQLKTYQCRVLISTDLTSRGIDADKVDLVINLDVPYDHETYLHRIGRAGRFGSFGAAVSIVSEGKEESELKAVERKCNTNILPLPDPLPVDLVKREIPINIDDIITTERIATGPTTSGQNILKNDWGLKEKSAGGSQNECSGDDSSVKCNDSYYKETFKQNGHSEEVKIQENISQNDCYGPTENKNCAQKHSEFSQSKSPKAINQSNNCSVKAGLKPNTRSKTKQIFSKMAVGKSHQSIASMDSDSTDDDDDDDDDGDDDQADIIKPSGQKFVCHDVFDYQNQNDGDSKKVSIGKYSLSKEDTVLSPTVNLKDFAKDIVSYQKNSNRQNNNKASKVISTSRQNYISEMQNIETEGTYIKDKGTTELDVFKNTKHEETEPILDNSKFLTAYNSRCTSDKEILDTVPGMTVIATEEGNEGNSITGNLLNEKQRILQSCQEVVASVQNLNLSIQPPLQGDSKKKHSTEQSSKIENSSSIGKIEVCDINYSSSNCSGSRCVDNKTCDILKTSNNIQVVDDCRSNNRNTTFAVGGVIETKIVNSSCSKTDLVNSEPLQSISDLESSVKMSENGFKTYETSAIPSETRAIISEPGDKTYETNAKLGETSAKTCGILETSAKTCDILKTSEVSTIKKEASDKTSESEQACKVNKLKLKGLNYACALERYNQAKSSEAYKDYDYISKICEQIKLGKSSPPDKQCEEMFNKIDTIYASFGKQKCGFLETKTQGTETDAIFENDEKINLSANNNCAENETEYADTYAIGKCKFENSVDITLVSQVRDLSLTHSDISTAQCENKEKDNLRNPSTAKNFKQLENNDETIFNKDKNENLNSQGVLNSENILKINHPETQISEARAMDPFDSEETKPLKNTQTFIQKHMKRCGVDQGNKPIGSDMLLRMDWKTFGNTSTTKDEYQTTEQSLKMGLDLSETGLQNSSLQPVKPCPAKVSISTLNGVVSLSDLDESSGDIHKEILPVESDSEIAESSSSCGLTSDSASTPSSDEDVDKRCRSNQASEYQNCYWNQSYFNQSMQWPYMDERSHKSAKKAHEDYVTSWKSYRQSHPSYMASTYSSKPQHTTEKPSGNSSESGFVHGRSKTSSGRTRKSNSSKYKNYAYSYPSCLDVYSYESNYYYWYCNQWLPWYQYSPLWQQSFWYPYSYFSPGRYPYDNHLGKSKTVDESVKNMAKLAKFQKDYIKMMSHK